VDLFTDGPEREGNYERRDYAMRSIDIVRDAWDDGKRYIPDKKFRGTLYNWQRDVERCRKFTTEEEWGALIRTTNSILDTSQHLDLDRGDRAFIINGFLKHYLWPCTNQVYGVRITNEHDWDLFMKGQLQRWGKKPAEKTRTGPSKVRGKKPANIKEWSLGVPENRDAFAKWFADEKTGKPIFRPSPSASEDKKQSK
jgi:hypothetical protein